MLDKMQIFVSIVASLIVTLISIYQDVSLHTLAVRLIVVIISFYAVGLAARIFLRKYVFFEETEEAVVENTERDEEDDDAVGDQTVFENFSDPPPKARRSKYD